MVEVLSSGYVLKVNQTGIMDKLVGTGPEKEKKKKNKNWLFGNKLP